MAQDHALDNYIDNDLIRHSQPALERREHVNIDTPVKNTDRSLGTMLSYRISKKWGEAGLPDDTIRLNLTGHAGQSMGAFLARGVTINLEGDANDYVGKGLSGGRIVIRPPGVATYPAEENILLGNVALYGATAGEAYFRGVAAERFCVRNSGAKTVVEGVGDHGCEYMTGGRVVILGETGRNFAAGMSGGIAYIYDPHDRFSLHCNLSMVELERLEDPGDLAECRTMIADHLRHTESAVAARILNGWADAAARFVKVMPIDYRRVLMQQKAAMTLADSEPEVGHG